MTPEVSVLVPVHDKELYLRACIASIVNQSHNDLEIICVDDGSTDGSAAILDEMALTDRRIRVLRNDRNLGPSATRNRALAEARGVHIRFVDADDLLPAKSTEVLLRRLSETGADLVRGNIALFNDDDIDHPTAIHTVPDRRITDFKSAPELWVPWWHTTYLIKTDLIRRWGIEFPDLKIGEDPVFLSALLTRAKTISLVNEVVYFYRKYYKTTGTGAFSAENALQILRQAALIKANFVAHHPPSWNEGYGPFLRKDFTRYLGYCSLASADLRIVEKEGRKIWGPETVFAVNDSAMKPASVHAGS